jgi:hypothetical protein
MREETSPPEAPVALASGPATGAVPTAEATVSMPGLGIRKALPISRVTVSPLAGRIALGVIVLATLAVVATATAGPSILVPRSVQAFPNWEAGPLHDVTVRLITNPRTLGWAFTGLLVLMTIAYGVVMLAVRTFSMRAIAIVIVALHAILFLSPPLQLTDVFNYLGYARLGAVHHLNPYTHTIKQEMFDPVYRFSSWHNLRSPYGELFTAISYPLALLPLATAYWILKLVTVLMSLAFIALIWHCARKLGRDPRFAIAFTALNPVFLIYAVAGFHNDFFMLVPSMGAIAFVLSGRDRLAGASLMLAIAAKFTAVILGPFLLLAVVTRPRQLRLIVGAVMAALPLLAGSLALFGVSLPNLQQQSSLLTDFSIPNLVGLLGGVGGTPFLLKVATVCVVLVVAFHFLYRRGNWMAGAGWSTLALILSLAWAVPWYVIWVLPLAALSSSVALRRTAVALTVFLLLAFVPATSQYMNDHGINPLRTPAGDASRSLQHKLAN